MANEIVTQILVLASSNKGKIRELQQLLGDRVIVVSASELDVEMPEETELTFAGNAKLKAESCYEQTGHISLADDSGLEVDALYSRPGVFSARYAGEHSTDSENNAKLLQELKLTPEGERSARFRGAIAVTFDLDTTKVFEGVCEGSIGFDEDGNHGFGYDPLFRLPDGRSVATLAPDEKNAFSHRGEALRKALPVLLKFLDGRD